MTEHSPPCLCPACGYDLAPLEGIDRLTCPECGELFSRSEANSKLQVVYRQKIFSLSVLFFIAIPIVWTIGTVGAMFAFDTLGAVEALFKLYVVAMPLVFIVGGCCVIRQYTQAPRHRRSLGVLIPAAWFLVIGSVLPVISAFWIFNLIAMGNA